MPPLYQHYVDMKLLVENAWERNSSPAFKDTMLLRSLYQAYTQIQQKLKLGDVRHEGNVTSGTDLYTIPVADGSGNRSPRFGRNLSIYVKPETGDGVPYKLEWKSQAWMLENFDLSSTTDATGFPRYWMETDVAPLGRIKVRPVPNFSRSSGMIFAFTAMPNESFAIYNQSAITATFTYGSTGVTFSSDPSPNVVQGYEIGVPPTTQLDGTTVEDDVPRTWVPLASVSGVNAVLASNWPGASGSGQRFIASVVQNLDQMLPGGLERLPSTLATAIYFRSLDPSKMPGGPSIVEDAMQLMESLELDQSAMSVGSFRKAWLHAPSGMTSGKVGEFRDRYSIGVW